jgi:hypothetical protein
MPTELATIGSCLTAVDLVRHRRDSVAADSVRVAIAETAQPAPAGRRLHILKQYAMVVVAGLLGSLDGRPLPTPADLPPGTGLLGLELIHGVSRTSANATWSALAEAAPPAERGRLLRLADRIFAGSQEIEQTALGTSGAAPTGTDDPALRQAVARSLVLGEGADETARRAGVRLASAYVAGVVERGTGSDLRPLAPWPALECRPDVLAAADGTELVVLVPALRGVDRSEIRSHAGLLRSAGPGSLVIGAAASADRAGVADAVAQARAVLQVVRMLAYPGGVYQVDDVPVEVSLMRSPDLAVLLSERLVPLYSSGAPLLETLRVYLETSQDRRQAAAALHIHSNTLDYRLRRIRELTGLSPTVPRDIQTLGAALTAWRLQNRPDAA